MRARGLLLLAMMSVSALGAAALAANERPASSEKVQAPDTAGITIDNFQFAPATLTVTVGTKVTWTNRDDMAHTVVSTDRNIKSDPLDTGDTFTYTFEKAGTFEYFCSLHPRMTGRVIVKER